MLTLPRRYDAAPLDTLTEVPTPDRGFRTGGPMRPARYDRDRQGTADKIRCAGLPRS